MKKTVLTYGLIAGLIVTAMMVYSTWMCMRSEDFKPSMVLGYAGMLLAFSFVFIGIKNYRDKHNQGIISFSKAFKIGLYISLIASTLYVVTWLIEYYTFFPDFMDKYTEFVLKDAKADGASDAELGEKAAEMAKFSERYKNPIFVVLITYAEILPLGILISLISAFILKRKSKTAPAT